MKEPTEFEKWIHDDICWCANSEECSHIKCERHTSNRLMKCGMYTAATFKGTEMCPLYKADKKRDETEKPHP